MLSQIKKIPTGIHEDFNSDVVRGPVALAYPLFFEYSGEECEYIIGSGYSIGAFNSLDVEMV